jgi:hypothetical protein
VRFVRGERQMTLTGWKGVGSCRTGEGGRGWGVGGVWWDTDAHVYPAHVYLAHSHARSTNTHARTCTKPVAPLSLPPSLARALSLADQPGCWNSAIKDFFLKKNLDAGAVP